MGLTLAEKPASEPGWSPFHSETPLCDLDARRDETIGGPEPPLGQLLLLSAIVVASAALSVLVPWAVALVYNCVLRRPRTTADNNAAVDDDEQDFVSLATGSPPTPPPATWLRDEGCDGTAVVQLPYSYPYATPPQPVPEPLLFSVSPPPGAGSSPYEVQHYPPVLPAGLTRAAQPWLASGSTRGDKSVRSLSGGPRRRRVPPNGRSDGWDPGLLSRQAALLPAISSVEGLMASAEFQEHVRSSRRRSPQLEREQAHAKVQLYKDLRRMDPDAFKRLLSRTDVKSFDARPPARALVIFDYLMGTVALPLALAALAVSRFAEGTPLLRYGPLLAWLGVRLCLASAGHVSLLGRLLGVYLVYDSLDGELYGNGWESMAGLGSHALLALCELTMALCSVGVLGLGAVASVAAGKRRQTLAMRLLRLRLEKEVARPTTLSPYSPPADAAAGPCIRRTASGNSAGEPSLGRYGLPYGYR